MLIQKIKGLQRTPASRQRWSNFCKMQSGAKLDPASYSSDVLRTFLASADSTTCIGNGARSSKDTASTSSGKGHSTNLSNLRSHKQIDALLDDLGRRAFAVWSAPSPTKHEDYRLLMRDLRELESVSPYGCQVQQLIASLLAKLDELESTPE